MINPESKLAPDIFTEKAEMKPTRDGFGLGVAEAGDRDRNVVVLTADLTESTRCHWFAEKYPERFIQVGIAEQNLVSVASGLANYGKIPFMTSYAIFSPGRNWEQIRTTIALNNVPVKLIGSHAGVSVGPDGATHQALEDIALMRALPNMIVIVPADMLEAKKATLAAAQNGKPTYIRLSRDKTPVFTTEETPFEIGKGIVLRAPSIGSGRASDVTIIACGILTHSALVAAEELSKDGIEARVINMHTIKPLDTAIIIKAAQETGAIVSAEEHQIAGGLGSAIAETLAQNCPVLQEFVGIKDRFGQSGGTKELLREYGLDVQAIKESAKKAISRK